MIADEEERMRRERQVSVPDVKVTNIRQLDTFRNTSEFKAYESLCRGEKTPALVRITQKSPNFGSILMKVSSFPAKFS